MSRISFLLFSLLSSSAFAQFPQPGVNLPQGPLQVMGVITGGVGCPQGSVNVTLSPDGSVFTVLYDKLGAQVGPGQPAAYADCTVDIAIHKPLMLGFSVESADFRGFVSLAPGVVAEQRVSLASGSVREIRDATANFGDQSWTGPVQQDYEMTTVRPLGGLRILNCIPPRENTHIVIHTQLQVQQNGNPQGDGLLSVDSTDGRLMQQYHLRWQNCVQDIGGLIGGIIGAASGHGPRRPFPFSSIL